jgi:methionyl-tRNA formyltransferase
MRIIFFGTPAEASDILSWLIEAKLNIVAVVTRPDRKKGRGLVIASPPVKKLALAHKIPVLQPEKMKDEGFRKAFASLKPDVCVVVAFGMLIPNDILEIPEHGFVNVHASLLPKYRGAAPIQRALMNGEAETGVTIFRLVEKLDAGDIIAQEKIKIEDADNYKTLTRRIFSTGGDLLIASLERIENGSVKFTKQDENKVTLAPKIERDSCAIDWKAGSRKVFNLVRALSPHTGAYTYYKKKLLKIFTAEPEAYLNECLPGTIIKFVKNTGFIVAAKDGGLLVKEVQPENGKRMSAWDFLAGHHLNIGDILPS